MLNFKTSDQLRNERSVLRSCIKDCKDEIKQARLAHDDVWAQQLLYAIHVYRKEIEQIDAALEA